MYTPSAFRQNDLPTLHALIDQVRLAVLVSHGENGIQASHLPLFLIPEEGEFGTLYGHFARGNEHWRALTGGAEALAIFQGVDAYVSPSYYPSKAEHGKVVPTWNYTAVHASGRVEVFDDADRLLTLVSRLSDRQEASRSQPWAVSDAPRDYIDGLLKAIVGFAMPIRKLEGQWKLSQNRSNADSEGVREGLAAADRMGDRQTSEVMKRPG